MRGRRRLDRFGRLEAERRRRAGGAPPAPGSSRLEARFRPEDGAPAGDTLAPARPASGQRSGGQPARFETPLAEAPLRVLEIDDSQPFVRCAECHGDGHATSVRCQHCGTDLTTREQRAFNEALWKRRLEEKAQEELEAERLRARREPADREMAEAIRLRAAIEQDLERRLALGLPLDPTDAVNPLEASARRAGRAIGRGFRRALPHRSGRVVFLGSIGAMAALLLAVSPLARWIFYAAVVLVLFAGLERLGGRR